MAGTSSECGENPSERLAREMSCTLTIRPSWAELLKMAQYASDLHEPLQEFIIESCELRYEEIDRIRKNAEELSSVIDELN